MDTFIKWLLSQSLGAVKGPQLYAAYLAMKSTDLKGYLQPLADAAVSVAKAALVGAVNDAIDSNTLIPNDLKVQIKATVDVPILNWKVKL